MEPLPYTPRRLATRREQVKQPPALVSRVAAGYFVVVEAVAKTFGVLHTDRAALAVAPIVVVLGRALSLPTRRSSRSPTSCCRAGDCPAVPS